MIRHIKQSCLLLLLLFSSIIHAQDDGILTFRGNNYFDNKPLPFTKVKVVNSKGVVTEFSTKDNHRFKTELVYGSIYDIYFYNSKTQPMFIRVYADIPEKKRYYNITYELDIPFFVNDPEKIDTTHFKKPFHQIVFDGKSKFVDDTVYMNKFIKDIYLKEKTVKKDTTVPFLTNEKIKEYVQLAGKLKLDNDKQTPVKNKQVTLTNKNGDIIAKSQTTENGAFVFQNVDVTQTEGLSVNLSSADNPTNAKVKLQTGSAEVIAVTEGNNGTYRFQNTQEQNVIKKLVDQDYRFSIGGKIIANNGAEKKVASDKNVYLINHKNAVVQQTKTNTLGNFLFTKIVPGYGYTIAYDSADAEPGFFMELYNTKDKFIKRLDSISKNKFIYRFLSVSGSTFNDLIIDEGDLKMNVRGKLYGDNKNNPLSNMKVMLLNDKYESIDSAMTNNNGDFEFRHLPYTKQILLNAENEKNVLEAFNNVLVFDNTDNLIKVVSLVKGKKFNYKPLATEQSRITEIYIDDPWLALIKKDKNLKTKDVPVTIIENILFEFNKSELLPQSKQTLDKVILVMQANKTFQIELSAHSDSKGSDAYNLKLSEQRANSAKNYIITKGIDASRIKAIGYGESKLLNNCGNNAICSDDEHAVNRRIEFKIIYN